MKQDELKVNVPKKYICCFCKKEFDDEGYDPVGATDNNGTEMFYNPGDKCCKFCNWEYKTKKQRKEALENLKIFM